MKKNKKTKSRITKTKKKQNDQENVRQREK